MFTRDFCVWPKSNLIASAVMRVLFLFTFYKVSSPTSLNNPGWLYTLVLYNEMKLYSLTLIVTSDVYVMWSIDSQLYYGHLYLILCN